MDASNQERFDRLLMATASRMMTPVTVIEAGHRLRPDAAGHLLIDLAG